LAQFRQIFFQHAGARARRVCRFAQFGFVVDGQRDDFRRFPMPLDMAYIGDAVGVFDFQIEQNLIGRRMHLKHPQGFRRVFAFANIVAEIADETTNHAAHRDTVFDNQNNHF
jgi:hypothetical protein